MIKKSKNRPRLNFWQAKCRAVALSAVTTNYSICNSQALVCRLPFLPQKRKCFVGLQQRFKNLIFRWLAPLEFSNGLVINYIVLQGAKKPSLYFCIFCYRQRWLKMMRPQTCSKFEIGQIRVLKFYFCWAKKPLFNSWFILTGFPIIS